jgi:hypothetical protein
MIRDKYDSENPPYIPVPEKRKPVPVHFYIELEDPAKKENAITILTQLFKDYSHFKNADNQDQRPEGVHLNFDDVPDEVGYADDLKPKIIEALETQGIKIKAKEGQPEIYIAYPEKK